MSGSSLSVSFVALVAFSRRGPFRFPKDRVNLALMYSPQNVVPWGRSFQQYRQMFALSDDDLGRRILGCADGPASFNAELTQKGGRVVSCDPLYELDAQRISDRIDETYEQVLAWTRQNRERYVWTGEISSVAELGRVRLEAMQLFLDDYEAGREQGRYVADGLSNLPFADSSFDLAICSHFLFLYSEQVSEALHFAGIREMCRVAGECRVFPLVEVGSIPSRHVDPLLARLEDAGMATSVERVEYEFQKGGNEMLRVFAPGRQSGQ